MARTSRSLLSIIAALSLILSFMSLPAQAQTRGSAQVRVLNQGHVPVDVYFNEVHVVHNLPVDSLSPYRWMPARSHTVEPLDVEGFGFPDTVAFNFAANKRYTIVVMDNLAHDMPCARDQEICMRLYTAPDLPARQLARVRLVGADVDLLTREGEVLISNDTDDEATVDLPVERAHSLCVNSPAGSGGITHCFPAQRLNARGLYTVWAFNPDDPVWGQD